MARETGPDSAQDDRGVYQDQGFGQRIGFGEKAALLIVDFVKGFTEPDVFGGGNISEAIRNTAVVLDCARGNSLPIAFTRIIYADDLSDAGIFAEKVPKLKELTRDNPLSHVVAELEPRPGEYVIDKTEASSFHATGLNKWLTYHRVDTLVVAGCVTSGCVRATVTDACAHNYRTIVPQDCVGDRSLSVHRANLFDMSQTSCDVISSDEAMAEIERLAADR